MLSLYGRTKKRKVGMMDGCETASKYFIVRTEKSNNNKMNGRQARDLNEPIARNLLGSGIT